MEQRIYAKFIVNYILLMFHGLPCLVDNSNSIFRTNVKIIQSLNGQLAVQNSFQILKYLYDDNSSFDQYNKPVSNPNFPLSKYPSQKRGKNWSTHTKKIGNYGQL